MSGVARIRLALVLVAIFAAALAFIGIQRIVSLTDKSAVISSGAITAEEGLRLLNLTEEAERLSTKIPLEELKERLNQIQKSKESFIKNLDFWLTSIVEQDETFTPAKEITSIEHSFETWRSSMLTVKTQPVTDTLYRAKAPRLKTKTRFQIRNLVSRLVVQIQLHSISVREQAAAGIRLLALIALAVAGIAAVMAWRLKARLEAPIERIYRVLGRALDGDLQRRTGLGNNDEISRIGMRVDRLLDRLERNDLNRMHSLRPTGANYHAPEKVIDETGEELPVEEEPLPIDESRQASLPMTMIHQLPEDE